MLKLRRDLKLIFGQYFADDWRCLVEVTKLKLGQDSEAKLGQDFKFSRDTVCLRFWRF